MSKNSVFCIGMGGTAAAKYGVTYKVRSGVCEFEAFEPAFVRLIKTIENAGSNVDFHVADIFAKDSKDITDEDIKVVKTTINKSPHSKIVVECGKDKIIEIAKAFCDIKDKTIVFTGAIIPAEQMDSEYPFNFGMALGAAQLLDSGVYIAMNTRIYHVDEVVRNIKTHYFEKINQQTDFHGKAVPDIGYGFCDCGGTMGKQVRSMANSREYEYCFGKITFAEKLWNEILLPTGVNATARFKVIMQKDSMLMTNEDRLAICEYVKKRPESNIIITHGTDTMSKTAETLSSIKDKKIFITGSTFPGSQYRSDAPINMGLAIAGANCIKDDGIYIAMSGAVNKWDKVAKNLETGIFESK